MTIWTINLYVLIAALILTALLYQIRKPSNIFLEILKNFVGAYFIFSGWVKAVDPIGTGIKMEEYFEIFQEYFPFFNLIWAFFEPISNEFSIFMILLELLLGFFLIMGAWKALTTWLLFLIVVFFTFLTGFSHFTGKVTDCGCFGDFIKLSPLQSFIKDIVLLVVILPILRNRDKLSPVFPQKPRMIALLMLTILSVVFTLRNVYYEPIIDFRAYKVGVNIQECLSLPEDATPYVYENIFIYRNKQSGETQEFSIESLPSDFENWEFVDRRDRLIQKGDDPACKDFAINNIDGEDLTDYYMNMQVPLFVISIPDLRRTNRSALSDLAPLIKQAQREKIEVIALTGSSIADTEAVLSDYDIKIDVFNTDATPLLTVMRSNPGLMVIMQGTIRAKYHYNDELSLKEIKESVLN